MPSIESLTYPKTNYIPFVGGAYRVVSGPIVDTSYNDDFITTYDGSVWTEDGGNSNVTLNAGTAGNPLTLSVNGASASASFYLNGDNTVTGALSFGWGFKIDDQGNTTNGINKVVIRALKPADDENIELAYEFDETNAIERLSLTYRDVNGVGDTTVTKDFVDRDASLRIVMANDRLAVFDEKDPRKAIFDEPYTLDWAPSFDIGVETPAADAGNVWTLAPKPFKWYPTISGIKDKKAAHIPWCIGYNKNQVTYYSVPGYPGEFTLTMKGTGTGDASTAAVGVTTVIMANHQEQPYRLLASNVEEFYDDAGDYLVCRAFAVRDEDNTGDNIVPMQCVDDGTAQDGTATDLVVTKSGELDDRDKLPRVILENGGVRYGESFRFDRILYDEGTDLSVDPADSTGDCIRYLRCLEMSNGDRCYYGVTHDPTYSTTVGALPADTGTIFEATSGAGINWTLYKVDSDGTQSSTDTGSFTGATDELFDLPSLSAGRYVLTTDTANTTFIGTIYGDGSGNDRIETTGGQRTRELWFEISDPRGKLVVFYHDRSANTVTKYQRGTAEVSNRRYNLSAVETDDGKAAIFYEDGTSGGEFGTYDHYDDRKLTYRIFDPAVGFDASTYVWELPSSVPNGTKRIEEPAEYQVHAFDVVKTNDGYNIFFNARFLVEEFLARDMNGRYPLAVPFTESGPGNALTVGENMLFRNSIKARILGVDYDTATTGTVYVSLLTNNGVPLDGDSWAEIGSPTVGTVSAPASSLYESVRRVPFLEEGWYVASFKQDQVEFGSEDYYLNFAEINQFVSPSHRVSFEIRVPDEAVYLNNLARREVDFISAEYDPDKDLCTVSTIDTRHRLPVVFLGKDDIFKEVCVPFNFKIAQYYFAEKLTDSATYDYFGVETYHATWGYDGHIYGVGCKPEDGEFNIELGVIDPALYWDNREKYLDRGPEFAKTTTPMNFSEGFDLYPADYTFEGFPLANLYGSTEGFSSASISRHDHYNILCLSGPFSFPTVLQNCEFDPAPFETSEEEVWFPEYQSNTDSDWDPDTRTVNYSRQYADVEERDIASTDMNASNYHGKVLDELDLNQRTLYDRGSMANIGYKFHARVTFGQTTAGSMTGMPTRDLYFSGRFNYDEGTDYSYTTFARFRANGTDLFCEVYDPVGVSWTTLHTFTAYLSSPEPVDYFILARIVVSEPGRAVCRLSFIYKRRGKNIEDQSADEYYSNYTTEVDLVASEGPVDVDAYPAPTYDNSFIGVYGARYDSGSAEATDNNVARIHQMGWAGLDIPSGIFFRNPKLPGSGAVEQPTFRGSSWRKLNDQNLVLASDPNRPQYGFRLSKWQNAVQTSGTMHWPNGFEYSVSGSAMTFGDRWELSREAVDILSYLESRRVHGIWYTAADTTDVHIWADAVDSNLGKFEVDTFMVMGANVPEVTLIGKNNLIDSWVEIDTLDLTRYVLDVSSHSVSGNKDVVAISNAEFIAEDIDDITHYFKEEGVQAGLVIDQNNSLLIVEGNEQLGMGTVTEAPKVFVDKGVKTLDQSVRYRFVGVKIPVSKTYEGYFKLHTLDFGVNSEVPLDNNHTVSSGKSMSVSSSLYYVFDNQPVAIRKHSLIPEFVFEYKIFDALTAAKYKSIVAKVGANRKPIWVFQEDQGNKSELHLCLITEALNHGLVIDEDGSEYYRMTVTLRSVS